jgi:uncharacterized protein
MLILYWICSFAIAIDITSVPNPRSEGLWVVDLVDIIDTDTEAKINAQIEQLNRDSTVEIALVTVDNVTSTPKEFATSLFNHWAVGNAEKNNGLLVLMVMGQRRLEMETGYGLEPILPDGWLGGMQAEKMVPQFKQGNFGKGLESGIDSVNERIRDKMELSPQVLSAELIENMKQGVIENQANINTPVPAKTKSSNKVPDITLPRDDSFGILDGVVVIVFVGVILGLRFVIRKYRRRCPTCKIQMMMLSEEEDDEHLSAGQQTEERIGSIDHQFYVCEQCGFSKLLSDSKWFSGYKRCSKCSYKTLTTNRQTITAATYTSGGLVRVTQNCSHCSYHNTYTVRTPKLPPPSSSSSSGGSSGGSFGGSSGGSFGGGSSGGGGAGSSW